MLYFCHALFFIMLLLLLCYTITLLLVHDIDSGNHSMSNNAIIR